MLQIILIVVAVLVVLLVIVVAMRPAEFRITRKATYAAPPAVVFGHVNDLHAWQAWSPWARMDPDAKNTFAGTEAGVGAIFSWDGNNKVGAGTMTVLESRPPELVRIRLDFRRPFTATNIAEFTFTPEGAGTQVVWSMTGTNNFMMKAFGLIMNCDKMIGGDFEKGLANLREVLATAS